MSKEKKKEEVKKVVRIGKMEAAIGVAASTDETRYMLNGVLFDMEKKKIVATDGRILMFADMHEDAEDGLPEHLANGKRPETMVMHSIHLKKTIRDLPKRKTLPCLNEASLFADKITIDDIDTQETINIKPIEGNYPNWEQVIPDFDKAKEDGRPVVTFPINVTLLEQIVKAAKTIGLSYGDAIKFTVAGMTKEEEAEGRKASSLAAVIKFGANDLGEITTVAMPMHID